MKSDDDIALKVARILKIFEYAAVTLLSLALIMRPGFLSLSGIVAITGIGLLVASPVAGVITAGVISYRREKKNVSYISLLIVIVYVMAVVISR